MDNNVYKVLIKVCSNPELRHAILNKEDIDVSSYGISKEDFVALQAKVAISSSSTKDTNAPTMKRC